MKFLQKLKIAIAALAIGAVAVVANAQVPARVIGTTTLGALSVTNSRNYSVEQLVRITVAGVLPADFTATVRRVSSAGVTNSVGTFIGTGGTGNIVATNIYSFKTDITAITAAGTNTGANVEIINLVTP